MATRYRFTDPATGVPVLDCEYCIDGHRPGRPDPVLGSYFDSCPTCVPPCAACRGRGVFVDACCLQHFVQRTRITHRLTTRVCSSCRGIVGFEPLHPTGLT
jgi:hypothetical protein